MRISDWSSDVCSSYLSDEGLSARTHVSPSGRAGAYQCSPSCGWHACRGLSGRARADARGMGRGTARRSAGSRPAGDRKSVVSGKSVSVRVDLGGRRITKIKSSHQNRIGLPKNLTLLIAADDPTVVFPAISNNYHSPPYNHESYISL